MIGLVSDFDGTLFFKEKEETIRTSDRMAIESFQKEGNLFGICTGRPLKGLLQSLENRICCDFYILSTGATILDRDMNVLYQKELDMKMTYQIWMEYKDTYNVIFQADGGVYTLKNPIPFPVKQIRIHDFNELEGKALTGIAIQCKDSDDAYRVEVSINEKYDVFAIHNGEYVDIIHKGCSKGNAIQELKKIYNLDQVMAIGDEHNDISMLQVADTSFSFTYSPSLVKESSTYVVDTMKDAINIIKKESVE